jgi:nicotinamidase-related amidase
MKLENIALILIDVQKGLDRWEYYGQERSQPDAESNCAKLLRRFRKHNLPVFHVAHDSADEASPLHPTQSGNEIKNIVAPIEGEPIYKKTVNSAFIGTGLELDLKRKGLSNLVIVGLTAEHCISTSVRMASNLGFNVILVSDATAAFSKIGREGRIITAESVHEVAIACLSEEFAQVTATAELLERLN